MLDNVCKENYDSAAARIRLVWSIGIFTSISPQTGIDICVSGMYNICGKSRFSTVKSKGENNVF